MSTKDGPTVMVVLYGSDLRTYCPSRYLDTFDAFVADHKEAQAATVAAMMKQFTGSAVPEKSEAATISFANMMTAGHHDMHARLRDLNGDGVAAEVIFHDSQNGEPIPFLPPVGARDDRMMGNENRFDPELGAVGKHIYNQWLADAVSIEPERHVGLAHLPMWDIDAAIAELTWAHEAGLRAVNFPAPRAPMKEYNHPGWEPFWSACEERNMALTTHVGGKHCSLLGPRDDRPSRH